MDEVPTNLINRLFILDYDSSVAMRYHAQRRSFLESVDRLDPALTVIFGSATFAAILTAHSAVAATAAAAATFVSALNLAFGLGERARLHDTLYRRWADFRCRLIEFGHGSDHDLRVLEVDRARIDADTPAQLRILTVICDDTERDVRRLGGTSHVAWWQRLTRNWIDLPPWRMKEENLQ